MSHGHEEIMDKASQGRKERAVKYTRQSEGARSKVVRWEREYLSAAKWVEILEKELDKCACVCQVVAQGNFDRQNNQKQCTNEMCSVEPRLKRKQSSVASDLWDSVQTEVSVVGLDVKIGRPTKFDNSESANRNTSESCHLTLQPLGC